MSPGQSVFDVLAATFDQPAGVEHEGVAHAVEVPGPRAGQVQWQGAERWIGLKAIA